MRECAPWHSCMRWGRFVQRRDTFGNAAKMLRNDLREEVTNTYFTRLLLSAEQDQNPQYLQPKMSFRSLNATHTFWKFKTASHLDLLNSQWGVMFYKSFFSVIYFPSADSTEIQAVQLTSSHNTLKRHARMCPMKACTNLPHPIFFIIFPNFFLKTNTDLIGQVCSRSVDKGNF